MSSRLVYFGNVISRTTALVDANLMDRPAWLDACQRFPPITPPLNPAMPSWETVSSTKSHRSGPYFRADGHRYSVDKPTEFPKDQQYNHVDQPYHIYFSKDKKRREFFATHPGEAVYLGDAAHPTRCERWMGGEKNLGEFRISKPVTAQKNMLRELQEIPDISIDDILTKTGLISS